MPAAKYLDFDLAIERSGENTYRARVLASPAGRAVGEVVLPFSDLELDNFLLRIGRPRRGVRRLESPEMKAARDFGGRLFKSVFGEELMRCLRDSLDQADRQRLGLRLRLNLTEAPGLVDLPWEFLYNKDLDRFYTLSKNTPVVRYLDLPEPIRPLTVTPPLRLLAMISSPSDAPGLDVEREWQNLASALQEPVEKGLLVLDRMEVASPAALQALLRRKEIHIFHFIGHGGFYETAQDGVLLLEDENRRSRPVSGQLLGTILHDQDSLRLAVLNACEGARSGRSDPFAGAAQSLVQQGIPAVIAMQFEVTDEAAITFAREFYSAVAEGYPVDAALAEARKAIYSQGNDIEWGTPVLYMRSPDGYIFDIAGTNAPRPAAGKEVPAPPGAAASAPLEALYLDGLSAYYLRDWATARQHFSQVVELDPAYKDASKKLEEAARQVELAVLYEEHAHLEQAGDMAAALDRLEKLARQDPSYKDVKSKLETLRKRVRLQELYTQAQELSGAGRWQAVINVFKQIQDIDAEYADPHGLLERATKEQEQVETRARLEGLHARALEAMQAAKWPEALALLEQIESIQPGFRQASALIQRAREEIARSQAEQKRSHEIMQSYAQAQSQARQGQWQKVLDILSEIRSKDADFQDTDGIEDAARQALARQEAEARKVQQRLVDLYSRAMDARGAAQWVEALALLEQVQAIQPGYREAPALIQQAREEIANAQAAVRRKEAATQAAQPLREASITKQPQVSTKKFILTIAAILVGVVILLLLGVYLYARFFIRPAATPKPPPQSMGVQVITSTIPADTLQGAQAFQRAGPLSQPSLTPWATTPPQPSSAGRIAFASNREGNWQVYVMHMDGSNLRSLTKETADDRFPAWSPWPLKSTCTFDPISSMNFLWVELES